MGPRRRARQVRGLDCASRDRRQPAAGHFRVRALQLTRRGRWARERRLRCREARWPRPHRAQIVRQHLIDPEICIRCNTCEETCPKDAVTHDGRNYVVDAAKCNFCNDCISPCPTGAIDNWRQVIRAQPYTLEEQFGWDVLPAQADLDIDAATSELPSDVARITSVATAGQGGDVFPPWSAAHPYVNVYTVQNRRAGGGVRQLPPHRRRREQRHSPHRARLRQRGVSRARRTDDRHPAAGTRCQRQAASRAPVFRGEPARGRTATLQQRLRSR